MKIAVILTCYNRKRKTISCLQSLYKALEAFNSAQETKIELSVFLTDDGCTDGTGNAVRELLSGKDFLIIQGNGNLYWAGGMRAAWKEALKRKGEWDYYLLINDDVTFVGNCFSELFDSIEFASRKYEKPALISGVTVDYNNPSVVTYGGTKVYNSFLSPGRIVQMSGVPMECDKTHANILLVPAPVVADIGIFYEGYRHAAADGDYSVMARKQGYPLFITGHACGYCEFDHDSREEEEARLLRMSLQERKAYFQNPLHSMKDYLLAIRRMQPARFPIVCVGRFLILYFPSLYYKMSHIRGLFSVNSHHN